MTSKLIIFDTETTDVDENARIVDITIYVCDSNDILNGITYHTKCNPGVPISFEAMAVHHITPEIIENLEPFDKTSVYRNLMEVNSPDNYIIAHNVNFDLQALKNEGFINQMIPIDTLQCVKHIYKNLEKHNLQYLKYFFGLYRTYDEKHLPTDYANHPDWLLNAHSSLGDVLDLIMLFNYKIYNIESNLKELVRLTNEFIPLDSMPGGKHKGISFRDLIIKEPDFIQWLKDQPDTKPEVLKSVEHWEKQITPEDIENGFIPLESMPFGKHEGKTFRNLLLTEKAYIQWLKSKPDMKANIIRSIEYWEKNK